jgi:hypothetical protein
MTREDRIFSEFIFPQGPRETGAQRSIVRIVSGSSKPLEAAHEVRWEYGWRDREGKEA